MNVTMFSTVSNRGSALFAGNLPIMQKPALKREAIPAAYKKNFVEA